MSNPISNLISGVTPQSTTAALAGQVPKESERNQDTNTGSSNIISGITPQSTTAELAGQVPKESERGQDTNTGSSDLPGSFPETPGPKEAQLGQDANTGPSDVPGSFPDTPGPNEVSDFSVNPIPSSSGIGNPVQLQPGEKVPDPSKINDNTISSTVRNDTSLAKAEDKEESAFGVSPLPATSGIGNPIQLQPGDKVPDPSTFTDNTIQSNVKLDKESYERGQDAPQLPNPVTPATEGQGGLFGLPGVSGTMIPESSLPMGGGSSSEDPGFTIQSAGAGSSTAALAANVPLEPRGVPEVVQESQQEAGVEAEASGNREAVKEKSAVEKELESKVPEEPATSEGTVGAATSAGTGAAGSLPFRGVPPTVQQSIDEINQGTAIAPTVPDVVQESITESHQSPEAAASKTMVQEKANVEAELLKGQTPDESTGEPAPSTSAALTESAPAATASSVQKDATAPAPTSGETSALPTTTISEPTEPAATPVEPSTQTSADPRSVPTTESATAGSSEPPASTSKETPALTPATQNAKQRDVSRSVSPMTRTGQTSQTQPSVTTGVGESSAPTESKSAAASSSKTTASPATSSSTDKKSKRASGFFGKLKSKFSDKDKDKK